MSRIDVALGPKTYSVRMFNLGELREVTKAVAGLPPIEASFEVLLAALEKCHEPSISRDEALKIPAAMGQINVAFAKIASFSGLEQPEPGEAKPATAAT